MLKEDEQVSMAELPPRARRIQRANQWCGKMVGTTSACAENTIPTTIPTSTGWNYLRVRGEYFVVR